MVITLVTGGIRSGKSSQAVALAGGCCPVLFVATAVPSDDEMEARIAAHRRERPAAWRTAEAVTGALADHVAGEEPTLLVDCLTLYVGRRMTEGAEPEGVLEEVGAAVDRAAVGFERSIFVTNEVGSGVVPDNRLAREFSETLGRVNQLVGARADEVLLMVSGIPMPVKRLDGQ